MKTKAFFPFTSLTAFTAMVLLSQSLRAHAAYSPAWFWSENSETSEAQMSASVKTLFRAQKEIPVLVFLKEQAVLSSADLLEEKEVKTAYAYKKLVQTAEDTQSALRTFLSERKISHRAYFIANVIAVDSADKALILELLKRSDVGRVVGNPEVKDRLTVPGSHEESSTSSLRVQIGDNIRAIGADRVWEEFQTQGQGITIASEDTGILLTHPALAEKYRGYRASKMGGNPRFKHRYNWHDAIHAEGSRCGADSPAPCDDRGHGTHTLATALGGDSAHPIGVAPKANWIACRNMNDNVGSPESYLECMQFFLAPYAPGKDPFKKGHPEKAPDIIVNSWGCPESEGCEGNEFVEAFRNLGHAGIFSAVSAGNNGNLGCGSILTQPATLSDLTFSVGSYDHRNKRIADNSSRGPSKFDGKIGPDLVAPGIDIFSASLNTSVPYTTKSGTSMAAPHVAGTVALLWSKVPYFRGKVEKTSELLRKAANPLKASYETRSCGGVQGSEVPNNTFGYGLLNAYEAVKLATLATPGTPGTPGTKEAPYLEKTKPTSRPSFLSRFLRDAFDRSHDDRDGDGDVLSRTRF